MEWLSAAQALALLGTQPQTLYANVSRGRIKARSDPKDSRRSLYRADDVRRLAQRGAGRKKQEIVAAEAMHWGEPVLRTSLSTVRNGRLLYRGEDACLLAETATLEAVAALLWHAPARFSVAGSVLEFGLGSAIAALGSEVATATLPERGAAALAGEANQVAGMLAATLAGLSGSEEPLHLQLAHRWKRPEAADALRRAMVLLADHELNASTFAARVAVSTGASLWAGTLAALATLSGPRHGLASREIGALAEDIGFQPELSEAALRDWLGEGRRVPGVGHPLYPDGDVRCTALLASFDVPDAFRAYADAAEVLTGDEPNVDFALAAMVARFDLPSDAAFTLFALARSIGWLAHMIEQIGSGDSIRPRARYEES